MPPSAIELGAAGGGLADGGTGRAACIVRLARLFTAACALKSMRSPST
jgi:hypothetical protein